VAEAVVTDTHPLLFHAAGSRRLGRRAAEVFDAAERQAAIVYARINPSTSRPSRSIRPTRRGRIGIPSTR
jgi:hypothetical protein